MRARLEIIRGIAGRTAASESGGEVRLGEVMFAPRVSLTFDGPVPARHRSRKRWGSVSSIGVRHFFFFFYLLFFLSTLFLQPSPPPPSSFLLHRRRRLLLLLVRRLLLLLLRLLLLLLLLPILLLFFLLLLLLLLVFLLSIVAPSSTPSPLQCCSLSTKACPLYT